MRAFLFPLLAIGVLVAGSAVSSAQEKKGEMKTPATGQSQRPADPKQAEPESSSHNADTPSPAASKPQNGKQTTAPDSEKGEKKQSN